MALELKQKIKEISEAMKRTKKCRMLQRYQSIKLYLEGYPTQKNAKIIDRTSEANTFRTSILYN